jgi:hypothetical protein
MSDESVTSTHKENIPKGMGADSVQTEPEKRRYRYRGSFVQQIGGWLSVSMGLAAVGFGTYLFDKGGWIGIPLGIVWAALSINAARFFFVKQRPLVIDETGITALVRGKPWKFIAWPEVTKIKRIRRIMILELGGSRNGYEFAIVGPHNEINLDDRISDFSVLLDTLNFYIQRYQIPLLALDRGTDTLDQIKATVKDKQERKKLLKEGVRSSISSL